MLRMLRGALSMTALDDWLLSESSSLGGTEIVSRVPAANCESTWFWSVLMARLTASTYGSAVPFASFSKYVGFFFQAISTFGVYLSKTNGPEPHIPLSIASGADSTNSCASSQRSWNDALRFRQRQ